MKKSFSTKNGRNSFNRFGDDWIVSLYGFDTPRPAAWRQTDLHSNFLVCLSGRSREVDIKSMRRETRHLCSLNFLHYELKQRARMLTFRSKRPLRQTRKSSDDKSVCRKQSGRSVQTLRRHNRSRNRRTVELEFHNFMWCFS